MDFAVTPVLRQAQDRLGNTEAEVQCLQTQQQGRRIPADAGTVSRDSEAGRMRLAAGMRTRPPFRIIALKLPRSDPQAIIP
jgi:hypothetical protein